MVGKGVGSILNKASLGDLCDRGSSLKSAAILLPHRIE